jgi:hypothetical protein
MARRGKRSAAGPAAADPEQLTVVVCRGGDCGSRRKQPGLDHGAQLAAIRAGVQGAAAVVPSKCLDACAHSNVIVVMPGAEGIEAGAEPVWVGEANDMTVTEDLIAWVRRGGPGVAPEPTLVEIQAFRPTRQSRQELAPGHALP